MDYRLETFVERPPWQQDFSTTSKANETNIGTEPHDFPLKTAAGVFLSKANNIAQVYLYVHNAAIITEALTTFIGANRILRMSCDWNSLIDLVNMETHNARKQHKYVMMYRTLLSPRQLQAACSQMQEARGHYAPK